MRRLALLILIAAAAAEGQFSENVTVERILVDARVTNAGGKPILGLTPEDFEVRIGGKRAEVLSVTWTELDRDTVDSANVSGERQLLEEWSAEDNDAPLVPHPKGRIVVVFVQTDFARQPARVVGHLRFRRYAEQIVEELEQNDRVAVFSFDSHLKFRLDLTSDKKQAVRAIRESIRMDRPPPPPRVPAPSLAPRLDRAAMQRAAFAEDGLLLVANALNPIPGPKTLILLGWGLGSRFAGAVTMRPNWPAVQAALTAARVTLFALDTTDADYHDLEIGLEAAAEATGGFYGKTHVIPKAIVDRLQRTLEGYYELELRRPEGLSLGSHSIDIRVKRRGAVVLAPSSYRIRM